MADSPKDFVLELMSEHRQSQGQSFKSREDDALAQSILTDAEARKMAAEAKVAAKADPKVGKNSDGERVIDHPDVREITAEEKAKVWRKRVQLKNKLKHDQNLFLKRRAMAELRAYAKGIHPDRPGEKAPEILKRFRRIYEWTMIVPLTAEDPGAARIRGTVEAAKIIEGLFIDFCKIFGRPWWHIKKDGKWIDPQSGDHLPGSMK